MQQLANLYAMRQPKYQSLLTVIGLALLGCSFIYLMAANWWMIPQMLQLSIAPILLLLSAVASICFANHPVIRESFDGLAALWIGLSLAVIGQVYQTGADSYLLFLIWSCMLFPWLIRRNTAVFTILMITLQLSLYLYFKQTFYLQVYPWAYVLSVNILSLVCFLGCIKYYPQLRYLFLFYFTVISVASMLSFLGYKGDYYYLVSALFLPMISLLYFYIKKQALDMSLAALIIAISITILIVNQLLEQRFGSDFSLFFVMAVVVFAWCAILGWALIKLVPHTRFHSVPIAFGAWSSGILLSLGFLGFTESIAILVAVIFILISAVVLNRNQHPFLRQFAYSLMICGQAAILWHSYDLLDSMLLLCVLQLAILGLSFYLRCHWVFIASQLIVSYIFIQTQFQQWLYLVSNDYDQLFLTQWVMLSLNLLCFSGLFLMNKLSSIRYRRSMLVFICVVVVLTNLMRISGLSLKLSLVMQIDWSLILNFIWIAITWHYILKPQFNSLCGLAFVALAVLVSLMGYFEIYIVLLVLAYAQSQRDKFIFALGILVLCFVMFLMYYNLELSFLVKSASIFISAIAVLIFAFILKRNIQSLSLADIDLNKHNNAEGEQ